MSLYKLKAVYIASERQYTATGAEVQAPWGGTAFTSYGRRTEKIDTRIAEAIAGLREFYRSVVTKRELSNTAKLSVFKSVFVPILTYGHESWVMTEKILSQVQAAEMFSFSKSLQCDISRRTA